MADFFTSHRSPKIAAALVALLSQVPSHPERRESDFENVPIFKSSGPMVKFGLAVVAGQDLCFVATPTPNGQLLVSAWKPKRGEKGEPVCPPQADFARKGWVMEMGNLPIIPFKLPANPARTQ